MIFEIINREAVYLWYYFSVQLELLFPFWVLGMILGSVVSVFFKERIHNTFGILGKNKLGILGIMAASFLGLASPLCMYGTIPVSASFSRGGMREDWLAAFMMSSILLNPQLALYSAALGTAALSVRVLACLVCGVMAGLLVRFFYGDKSFFNFQDFALPESKDRDSNLVLRFLKNLGRNVKATGLYFLAGIVLSAVFQRYVPADTMTDLLGGNEAWGVLMAATIGVPLYACGGGTIPLLQGWLWEGMSMGSAAAFMITGPATKITNLGALKIILGAKGFFLYLAYIMIFSMITGLVVNWIL